MGLSSKKVTEKKCPRCAELVKAEALVCRFCGHDFEKVEVSKRRKSFRRFLVILFAVWAIASFLQYPRQKDTPQQPESASVSDQVAIDQQIKRNRGIQAYEQLQEPRVDPAEEAGIKRAEEALTLHYIENKIYDPVRCSSRRLPARTFVLCYPGWVSRTDIDFGGLFEVRVHEGEALVCAVNGKAMNHLGRGSGRLTDADLRRVDTFKPCRIEDIPSVFEFFRSR